MAQEYLRGPAEFRSGLILLHVAVFVCLFSGAVPGQERVC